MKRFAVFDIDGTLVRWQLYHAIGDAFAKHGHINKQDYQKIKEARFHWKKREHQEAFRAYEQEFITAFDAVMPAISTEEFKSITEEVFLEYRDQVYTYTRDIITKLKQQDYILFAISGSPYEIVKLIADYYGFDDFVGSTYEHDGKHYTGNKTVTANDKKTSLETLVNKHGLAYEQSYGFGDSQGDITMLEYVAHPVAFNPSTQLAEYAKQKGWNIVVERKNVIYELHEHHGQYVLV
jgi:HAD superfamily hydrolase (TIGR01490 family)